MKKPLFGKLAINLNDLKMDLVKWQLNFGSCNFAGSEIILVNSNRSRAVRSFDFEITRSVIYSTNSVSKRYICYTSHLSYLKTLESL